MALTVQKVHLIYIAKSRAETGILYFVSQTSILKLIAIPEIWPANLASSGTGIRMLIGPVVFVTVPFS